MCSTKKRLLNFMKYKGLSQKRFEMLVGLSNGYINNSSDPTSSKLEKVLSAFPDLSPEWLVTGKGEMLRSEGFSALRQQNVGDHGKNVVEVKETGNTGTLQDIIATKDKEIAWLRSVVEHYIGKKE